MFILPVTGYATAQTAADGRRRAETVYAEGRFAEAAELWAAVAQEESSAVDARLNAAQAYLQADDLGQAMLWFRRAQALDPRHPAVQLGAALVRALRVDILGDEPGVLPALERLTIEVVSANELAWLTVIAWSCAFGFGAAMLWRPRHRWTALAFMLAAALLLGLSAGRDLSQRVAPSAVIVAFESLMMSEPNAESVALSRVYAAAEARVASMRDGWILVTLPDGRAGWLPEADVALVRE